MSIAPMLRANRATSGAMANEMTPATRNPQRASMWLIGTAAYPGPPMRIWIDRTAPAHRLVFRPIIARFSDQGHEAEGTAAAYAQTPGLLKLLGIDPTRFGRNAAR